MVDKKVLLRVSALAMRRSFTGFDGKLPSSIKFKLISYRILEKFVSFKSYFKFLNWSNKRSNPTAFQDPYFEAEVQVMAFSPLPSTHQELCLMYTFISKLCNCLRNAHNSVAVLDEKNK